MDLPVIDASVDSEGRSLSYMKRAHWILGRKLTPSEESFIGGSGTSIEEKDTKEGLTTYSVEIVETQVKGSKIPLGLWNYYPEVGVFGLTHAQDSTTILALVNIKAAYSLSKDQSIAIGNHIARYLTGEDVAKTIRYIGRTHKGMVPREADEHPLCYLYRMFKGQVRMKESTAEFRENDWKSILGRNSLFRVPWRLEVPEDDLVFEAPAPGLRDVYVSNETDTDVSGTASFVDVVKAISPVEGLAMHSTDSLRTFTAKYKLGFSGDPTPTQVAVVNLAQIIKGSGTLLLQDSDDLTAAPLSKADVQDIQDNYISKGFLDDRLTGTAFRKLSKDNDFKKLISSAVSKSIDWAESEREPLYAKLLVNYLKYFDQICGVLVSMEGKV